MAKNQLLFTPIQGQLDPDNTVFPRVVVNDGITTVEACQHWIKENQPAIEQALKESGAVLFRGFPIKDAEDFDAFSDTFGYPNFTYQESLSNAVRINFTERVFTANEAPKEVDIYLHNEMAQTPISPSKLFFFCKSAAEEGGETPLCRTDMLFALFQQQMPITANDFISKGLKYTTHMPSADDPESGQGRSWKSTLSVDTIEDAEAKLKELGYSWDWKDDGSLRATTPALPAVIDLGSGRQVFYNQLIAAYLGWKGVKENPASALTFGDGSEIPVEALDLIVTLSAQCTFDVPWQDGDVALVDNYMAMHGRRAFKGERKRQVLAAFAAD